MACDRKRWPRARPGADRLGQDARGVPRRDRPSQREPGRGPPAPLHLPAQGAELRHRAEPSRPTRGPPLATLGRRPHGRHAAARAAADAANAARRPDHDPRVALPPPDLAGQGDAANGRDGDPGRGARGRGHEARLAPLPFARAPRTRRREALPAHRPLGDTASARGDRPLRRGHRPRRSSSWTPATARSSTSRSSSRSRTCAS